MIVITHSDIAQFLKCRRQWRWGFVEDRSPEERVTGALAIGSRVHECLEYWYKRKEDPVETHDRIIAETITKLEENDEPGWELDKLYEDAIVGRNCVVAYMDWLADSGADDGLVTDGVEAMIEAPILDGRVLLRGKVDVRFRRESDGALVICDFKTTGKSVDQLIQELERSYQSFVYAAIQQRVTPDDYVVGGMYRIIRKVTRKQHGKNYVEQKMISGMARSQPHFERQIFAICEEMSRVLSRHGEVDSDELFYMSPGDHCSWCAFKNPCTIANENPSAASDMLDELFTPGRHRRYDPKPDMTKETHDV